RNPQIAGGGPQARRLRILVGRGLCSLLERLRRIRGLAAFLCLERAADERVGRDHVRARSCCGRGSGESDGEEEGQSWVSKRPPTVRRIAAISRGSDNRWPPPLIVSSWTSAERRARMV